MDATAPSLTPKSVCMTTIPGSFFLTLQAISKQDKKIKTNAPFIESFLFVAKVIYLHP
jgi:hypothetical protein